MRERWCGRAILRCAATDIVRELSVVVNDMIFADSFESWPATPGCRASGGLAIVVRPFPDSTG